MTFGRMLFVGVAMMAAAPNPAVAQPLADVRAKPGDWLLVGRTSTQIVYRAAARPRPIIDFRHPGERGLEARYVVYAKGPGGEPAWPTAHDRKAIFYCKSGGVAAVTDQSTEGTIMGAQLRSETQGWSYDAHPVTPLSAEEVMWRQVCHVD